MSLRLIIGNKRYSSWSLRTWLMLRLNDIPFQEERIALYHSDYKTYLQQLSPGAQVPILCDSDLVVFDSLSIAEYIAETFAPKHGWPTDKNRRAQARSLCALMHAGFQALRQECPMNVARQPKAINCSASCTNDIDQLNQLLTNYLRQYYGPFLFGDLSFADAYYAPVIIRLDRYALLQHVHVELRAYAAHILALPAVQDWVEDGRQESERIAKAEIND